MKYTLLLIVSGLLLQAVSGFGQDAQPSQPNQPHAGQWVYVSGFEATKAQKHGKAAFDYTLGVLGKVRSKWYPQIPELEKSGGLKQGATSIEVKINHDASLGSMKIVESTGDARLDAAAQQAISSSQPFRGLPESYQGKDLNIRLKFGYFPASDAVPFCEGPNWGAHSAAYTVQKVGGGITPPKTTYAPDPEYSEEARRDRYMSSVQIAGTVDPQGEFTDLCVTQAAGKGLDEKALSAVQNWKFEPASLEGQPVAVRVLVEVTFELY